MPTLEEEWLGECEPDILDVIKEALVNCQHGEVSVAHLCHVLIDADVTIRSLRTLSKLKDQRIDALHKEITELQEGDKDDYGQDPIC